MPNPRPSRSQPPRSIHLAILGFLIASLGPVPSAGAAGPCNLPPNLTGYFRTRYGIAEGRVTSRSEKHNGAPFCIMTVHAELQPPENPGGDTPLQRARSVAWAIVEREKDLLGIPDLTEIKEKEPVVMEDEFIGIGYERQVGGVMLADMYLYFRFRGGTLYQFEATLVPVIPEVYEAVKRERLSADQIKAIVAQDLDWPAGAEASMAGQPQAGVTGRPPDLRLTDAQIKAMQEQKPATPVPARAPEIGEPILMALSGPPYLLWGVAASKSGKARWAYAVNAFSGEILAKNCTARTMRPRRRYTPCD